MSDGTVFIVLCFITRCINAIGFSAAVTASFAVLAKVFPDNIATVLVRCGQCLFLSAVMVFWSKVTKEALLHVTKDVLFLKRIIFRFSYSVCLVVWVLTVSAYAQNQNLCFYSYLHKCVKMLNVSLQ